MCTLCQLCPHQLSQLQTCIAFYSLILNNCRCSLKHDIVFIFFARPIDSSPTHFLSLGGPVNLNYSLTTAQHNQPVLLCQSFTRYCHSSRQICPAVGRPHFRCRRRRCLEKSFLSAGLEEICDLPTTSQRPSSRP